MGFEQSKTVYFQGGGEGWLIFFWLLFFLAKGRGRGLAKQNVVKLLFIFFSRDLWMSVASRRLGSAGSVCITTLLITMGGGFVGTTNLHGHGK